MHIEFTCEEKYLRRTLQQLLLTPGRRRGKKYLYIQLRIFRSQERERFMEFTSEEKDMRDLGTVGFSLQEEENKVHVFI